ncbi:MAG: PAS domain S-box protein [Thermodesulfovibrionia bacterium]|nr:PAS domain S-box protein [Thermodesulfovibrionia bacterium]
MTDTDKTKEKLKKELEEMRKHITKPEKVEAERKHLDKKHGEEKTLFYALFNQAHDSIFLMDPSPPEGPIIIDANKSACVIHGYTREELIGKPISFVDDPETTKQIPQRTRRLVAGEVLTFEAGHVRKDGSVLLVEVSAQIIDIGGKSYILAIDRDITERKKIEKELKERVEELEKFYEIAIGRELKMKNLQEEIERLKYELSQYKK